MEQEKINVRRSTKKKVDDSIGTKNNTTMDNCVEKIIHKQRENKTTKKICGSTKKTNEIRQTEWQSDKIDAQGKIIRWKIII